MSAAIDPEELRGRAGRLLADERAARALERAALRLQVGAMRWEGSEGEVWGHRVVLGLDGATLGELDAHPGSLDALEEALARSLGRGHSLVSLELRWELETAQEPSYRQAARREAARHDPEAWRRALVAYLTHRGEAGAASWVVGARDPTSFTSAPGELRSALGSALSRLRGSP